MAYAIDQEVKAIVDSCYAKAKEILTERRELLDRIAAILLEREVLDGKEFEALMNGEELPPKPERKNGNGNGNGNGSAPKQNETAADDAGAEPERTGEPSAEGEVPPPPEGRNKALPKDGLLG